MLRNSVFFFAFLSCSFVSAELRAQRIYQQGTDLVLEGATGRARSLGSGFNPVPISDHEYLLIRGANTGYGADAVCDRPAVRNRVVLYDMNTDKETLLYNKPLSDRTIGLGPMCVYGHADLSPTRSTLYIVSPCYATAGCLAMIDLPTGRVAHIAGSMDVFVIRGGSNAGDLIYMRRLPRNPSDGSPMVYYAYIHARPDGSQIAIISDEALALNGGNAPAPILRDYLRSVDGRIFVQGEWVP